MARGDFCLLAEGTWPGQTLREPPLWGDFSLLSPLGSCGGMKDGKGGAGSSSSSCPRASRGAVPCHSRCPCVLAPRGMSVHPLLRIPEPSPPAPLSLPSASPSAQPDGRSPGKANERYSGAFGESRKVGAPPAHPDPYPIHGDRGAEPQTQRGSVPRLAFPSCCQTRRASLLQEQTVVIPPSALFSPPPPHSERGVSVHRAYRTPCRSRVRK